MERVIRKRMRKDTTQLQMLHAQFNHEPYWTKEILADISIKTGLTEAQVYKWGWDQKRKKFGVEEAEKMMRYENVLDQQNAAKSSNIKQLSNQIKQVNISNST
jgi:hypothetical protein